MMLFPTPVTMDILVDQSDDAAVAQHKELSIPDLI